MKTQIKEMYKCDHCGKWYHIKNRAIEHEQHCTKNPINKRPCHDCQNLTKEKTRAFYDTPMGEYTYEVELLYCAEKKMFVYPPKVERKKNAFELYDEDLTNEPMPKECNVFKSLDYDMCLMHPRS